MVQQASRPAWAQETPAVACRHHWIIEAPVGPVSRGVCQECSEVREFKNYIESAPWGEDTPARPASRVAADSPDDPDESEEL